MLGAFSPLTVSAADLVVDIGTPPGGQYGPLLVGANVVYSHEGIRSWQDGEEDQALIDSVINNLRYPGGHLVGNFLTTTLMRIFDIHPISIN